MDVPVVWVAKEPQQPGQEIREVGNELEVRNRIKQSNPANQELPRERVDDPDAPFEQGDEALEREGGGQRQIVLLGLVLVSAFVFLSGLQDGYVGRRRFRDDVLDKSVKQFGAVLHRQLRVCA